MKIWTREELTALTPEQYNALPFEERIEVNRQGKAFMYADRLPSND